MSHTFTYADSDILKIDRSTGYVLLVNHLQYVFIILLYIDYRFVEFPQPGDTKKYLLPVYVDPEEELTKTQQQTDDHKNDEQYWMPVRNPENVIMFVLNLLSSFS
jgi:hypothetical protein